MELPPTTLIAEFKLFKVPVFLWRRANARNVRLYIMYLYRQYTNLFIFRCRYIYSAYAAQYVYRAITHFVGLWWIGPPYDNCVLKLLHLAEERSRKPEWQAGMKSSLYWSKSSTYGETQSKFSSWASVLDALHVRRK